MRFVGVCNAHGQSGFKSVMGNEYCGMSMSGVGCTLIEAKRASTSSRRRGRLSQRLAGNDKRLCMIATSI